MARTLYKDTTGGVDHLVAEIRRGDIALPELQRPFVWKATQVRDLFDSMYKGFPVGSLLFWLTGAEPGARQIGTNIKDHAPRALVVDGQQRLTALYAVLTGEPVLRGDYSTGRIRIAFRPADATFAVTDAAIEKDPEYLADVSTLWQPGNRKPTIRRFIEGLTEKRELDQDERDRLETALEELHDLNKSTFKVVELDADIDEEQVAEIFVRINSEGVKLNQADFILTLMSVYWPAGRAELERFCRDAREPVLTGASPFNWYIRPEADQLLRVTTRDRRMTRSDKPGSLPLRGRSGSKPLATIAVVRTHSRALTRDADAGPRASCGYLREQGGRRPIPRMASPGGSTGRHTESLSVSGPPSRTGPVNRSSPVEKTVRARRHPANLARSFDPGEGDEPHREGT